MHKNRSEYIEYVAMRSSLDLNMINSSDWPKMNKYNAQIDDDDVFMVSTDKSFQNEKK